MLQLHLRHHLCLQQVLQKGEAESTVATQQMLDVLEMLGLHKAQDSFR